MSCQCRTRPMSAELRPGDRECEPRIAGRLVATIQHAREAPLRREAVGREPAAKILVAVEDVEVRRVGQAGGGLRDERCGRRGVGGDERAELQRFAPVASEQESARLAAAERARREYA